MYAFQEEVSQDKECIQTGLLPWYWRCWFWFCWTNSTSIGSCGVIVSNINYIKSELGYCLIIQLVHLYVQDLVSHLCKYSIYWVIYSICEVCQAWGFWSIFLWCVTGIQYSLKVENLWQGILKVKNDHRSKFSNLSNWKEEAWKNQGFNGSSKNNFIYTLHYLQCLTHCRGIVTS